MIFISTLPGIIHHVAVIFASGILTSLSVVNNIASSFSNLVFFINKTGSSNSL
ncbi:MAG: hypothetical protein Q8S84_00435 [bacterium]|nr:hypothetical protein [bacterium]MDP3380056.1 hypothetical protein [bacterium]